MMTVQRKFLTGLSPLDRQLDGGLAIGSLVAFVAPTRTQSELLLYQFATTQPTHYISTTCPTASEFYARLPAWVPQNNISFQYIEPTEFREMPESVLDTVEPETYVIVDNTNPFERVESRADYLAWLNALSDWIRRNDSIGILHCTTDLEDGTTPQWRQLTEKRADYTWEIHRTVSSRQIQVQLVVAKARGERALTEPLPLLLTDRVRIDTSRSIA